MEATLYRDFDTLAKVQEYVWGSDSLQEVRVHPRHERIARLWCEPPPLLRGKATLAVAQFALHIDYSMPEDEVRLVHSDGRCETIPVAAKYPDECLIPSILLSNMKKKT